MTAKVDNLFDQLESNLEDIMLNRDIDRIFSDYNSGYHEDSKSTHLNMADHS